MRVEWLREIALLLFFAVLLVAVAEQPSPPDETMNFSGGNP